YQFGEIEAKWKKIWEERNQYKVHEDHTKPKCYVLDMFPYPSGAGLHVGHPLGYIASDIYSRFKRLNGYNVLHPMGFDAFGLPAEQYAIETGQHPATTTENNIQRYREQLGNIGFCYDWSRSVRTSDPTYYRWTQWIFLQLFNSWFNPESGKAEPISTLIGKMGNLSPEELMTYRLAYRSESYVNWCEALGTVLANDEVVNGVSERGGHPVEKKKLSQWFLRITSYAERLLTGLDQVEFPESLKEMQRNWIGKSEGAEIDFKLKDSDASIRVYTTRPDTIFGVSFMVLAPEHELVMSICSADLKSEVEQYIRNTSLRSERDRMAEAKKVSGCFSGAYAIHPFTGKEIPVWIADYVLMGYGTGAIMAVPAGDSRDHAFAKHFGLAIPGIFEGMNTEEEACEQKLGRLTHSEFLDGLSYAEALSRILSELEEKKCGQRKVNYRMRDAGFSRQRYWGEPFPIVYNEAGEAMALPEEELPLLLPHLETYGPGPNAQGPLANATDWIQTTYRDQSVTREIDTMPGYAGSSWYYLRYMDPENEQSFCDRTRSDYWNQVDVYIGGAEHAVGHLLYSRMWCKVLCDLGLIGFDEPFRKLINQGMIQGNSRLVYRIKGTNTFVSAGLKEQYETDTLYTEYAFCNGLELNIELFKNWKKEYQQAEFILENGKYICGALVEKMSKRLFNVVNPDDIIKQYGADTFRMYEMFLGPLEISKPWDTNGIEGVFRFLKKTWRLFADEQSGWQVTDEEPTPEEYKVLHKCIRKVKSDTESFAMNTAVSQFMITVNELSALKCHKRLILEPLCIILSPYAPHLAEELWSLCGHTTSVLDAGFPDWNEAYLQEHTYLYPVAINGKTRTEIEFALDLDQDTIQAQVLGNEVVQRWMEGKPLKKLICIKGKMINVVV
ncbi:MAG TPA: leucine--tRNA ligase, partial [Chitinophagaceae bacterium]|nr:leucine--tRNA ligase [Chitinophagaceae bacterium]